MKIQIKIHLVKILPIVFFFAITNIISQIKVDTLQASRYYQKADSLLAERKMDSSIVYFQRALPIYEKAKAWEKVASCYNKISENQLIQTKLGVSFQNAEKALKICKSLNISSREEAKSLDNLGMYYRKTGNYDKSMNYFTEALEIKKRFFPVNQNNVSKSYNELGINNLLMNNFSVAKDLLSKALSMKKQILGENNEEFGVIYNNLGTVEDELGNFKSALDYYKKGLDIFIKEYGEFHLKVGYIYSNLGLSYTNLNRFDEGYNYINKALRIFEKTDHLEGIESAFINIATYYQEIGEFDKAILYHKKAQKLTFQLFPKDHPYVVQSYLNMGIILYDKGNLDEALEHYKKAISIASKRQESINYFGFVNRTIGKLYQSQGKYSLALEHCRKAKEICEQIYGPNHSETLKAQNAIGDVYFEQNNLNEALHYYEITKDLMVLKYGETDISVVSYYLDIINVLIKKGNYEKALSLCEVTLLANQKEKTTNQEGLFNHLLYFDPNSLLSTLNKKAFILRSFYEKTKEVSYLLESIKSYANADFTINKIRESYQTYNDKISFAKETKEIYASAIKACLLLYKEHQHIETLEKAFYYAEKSKSNTLKDLLNETYAKDFTNISSDLTQLESNLKSDKAFYQSQIVEEQSRRPIDSTKINKYEDELFTIHRKQDSLIKVLENEYPNYYQLKHESTVVSIAEIQQSLSDEKTILEFVTVDSLTYAFTISKSDFDVTELNTPRLSESINELKKAILTKDLKTYKNLSFQLYQTLINPMKEQLKGEELVIVPDGFLWHLNFDVLLTENSTSNNPKDLPYLMEEYAISYANSGTLLIHPFPYQKPTKKRKECLAFSFSESTTIVNIAKMSLATLRDSGDDLPGTRKEIKAISEIVEGQYFYGSEAIEANFKKNVSEYNILHLALHGEVNNERPEQSRLYFTKIKDTVEDNYLYAHELFALDIPAELTVLSACNTGSGKIAKGEGIMSLGNAFQYAGTKSLLLTNWEVSDETTPQLMKNFYTNLKEGMSKSKALQQAKLQYIQTADAQRTSPFYWGGFYLVGDTAPIEFSNDRKYFWIAGIGLVIILLGGLFWYRNKTRAA